MAASPQIPTIKQRTIACVKCRVVPCDLDLVVECGTLGRPVMNRAMMIMTRFSTSSAGGTGEEPRAGYRAVLLLRHMHTAAPSRKIALRTVGPRRTVPASAENPVYAVTTPPTRKPSPDTTPTQPSQRG